jgi:ribosomal-protein-alanine N-acetyltransferase
LIGSVTLFNLDFNHRRAEIGYALGREHWGQGYMNEALQALLAYAFETLDLHRIEADIDPRNIASIKTVERLGFKREGYLRERWQTNGEIQDAFFYGLLRREWVGQADDA